MSNALRIITTEMQLQLMVPGAAARPMPVTLRYDPADPYAVTAGFQVGTAEVVSWTFARQLLADGLQALTGGGDVQVWPSSADHSPVVCLSLSSPSGEALFEVPQTGLADFLSQTYDVVAYGSEAAHVDVDAELALLLWAEPDR